MFERIHPSWSHKNATNAHNYLLWPILSIELVPVVLNNEIAYYFMSSILCVWVCECAHWSLTRPVISKIRMSQKCVEWIRKSKQWGQNCFGFLANKVIYIPSGVYKRCWRVPIGNMSLCLPEDCNVGVCGSIHKCLGCGSNQFPMLAQWIASFGWRHQWRQHYYPLLTHQILFSGRKHFPLSRMHLMACLSDLLCQCPSTAENSSNAILINTAVR